MPLAKSFVIMFGAGIVFGFSFAFLILQTNYSPVNFSPSEMFKVLRQKPPARNESELCAHFCAAAKSATDNVRESEIDIHPYEPLRNVSGTTLPASSQSTDEDAHAEEVMEAQRLAQEVRVICWVMTNPSDHQTKAIHVKNTWGKRCNKLIFMSSQSDEKLGAVGLPNVEEGRDWLWAKTKEAFKYVWEHHGDEADWFMKADDDTYVVVENLRYMLSHIDPDDPVYFGCRFKLEPDVKQGYMSGGAGYVLSREGLKRFVEEALPYEDKCYQSHDGEEDVEIGKCLEAVGVEAGDSRDGFGRYRFFPLAPEDHVSPGTVDESYWYWQMLYYPQSPGMNGCSEVAVSFHYISPEQMYVMEYLIYRLRVFGSVSHHQWLKEPNVTGSTYKDPTPAEITAVEEENDDSIDSDQYTDESTLGDLHTGNSTLGDLHTGDSTLGDLYTDTTNVNNENLENEYTT